jgi:hypothetical protein
VTLRNNEELLHHALYELLHVIARLGPRNVYVSVFENNSKDKTPQFLALFTDLLKLAGIGHHLVSTFTIRKELEAAAAVHGAHGSHGAAPAAAGRSLAEVDPDAPLSREEMEAAIAAELAMMGGGDGEETTEAGAAGEAAAASWARAAEAGFAAAAEAVAGEALETEATAPLYELAREIGAAMRAEIAARSSGGAASEPAAAAASAAAATRGRRLAEAKAAAGAAAPGGAGGGGADNWDADWAILTEGKWTGNRIEFLAKVRNRSIRPLLLRKEQYDRVILMNDAIFCAEDVLRLALHQDADVACGLDFDTTAA